MYSGLVNILIISTGLVFFFEHHMAHLSTRRLNQEQLRRKWMIKHNLWPKRWNPLETRIESNLYPNNKLICERDYQHQDVIQYQVQ